MVARQRWLAHFQMPGNIPSTFSSLNKTCLVGVSQLAIWTNRGGAKTFWKGDSECSRMSGVKKLESGSQWERGLDSGRDGPEALDSWEVGNLLVDFFSQLARSRGSLRLGAERGQNGRFGG
jgi:hypothetical protein